MTDTHHTRDVAHLNTLSDAELRTRLTRCCTAQTWVDGMLAARPFRDEEHLHKRAEELWPALSEADWLEAFEAHPTIGDVNSLKKKYADTLASASHEQSGAREASEATLQRLKALNDLYLERFGFIFIVCATGKSADEMLALLEARIDNTRNDELQNAAREQAKITHLRLETLL